MKWVTTVLFYMLGTIQSANAAAKVLEGHTAIVQQIIEVDIDDKNCIDSTAADEESSGYKAQRDFILACGPRYDYMSNLDKPQGGKIVGSVPTVDGDFKFFAAIRTNEFLGQYVHRILVSVAESEKAHTHSELLARLKAGFKVKLVYQGPQIGSK